MYGATGKIKETDDATHEIVIAPSSTGYHADEVVAPTTTIPLDTPTTPTPVHLKKYFPRGLMDMNGNDVPLNALSGKLTALYFGARWCPPCKILTPQVVEFRNKHRKLVEFVYCPNDMNSETVIKDMKEKAMEFPSMKLEDNQIMALFDMLHVTDMPKIIVVNEIGEIVSEYGIQAIESNPDNAVHEWLDGYRGCSWIRTWF